ncbi:MAG: hypothetical protein KJ955_05360 [Nanoarchaeota archaeon]|nr:hypothetical protein [Nanoarchaeota archaeon]
MKISKPAYILAIIGIFIGFMLGGGIIGLAFSSYISTDNLFYRIVISLGGVCIFSMFHCGLVMVLKYKKELSLSDEERKKQWKNLDPQFRNLWAFLMNIATAFFAIGLVFAIITAIVYKNWTQWAYIIPFIGMIIWDIRSRKRHPEQYRLISIYAIENIKPPFWKRFCRHILWSPIAFVYALKAFFGKQPNGVTRRFLFGLLYKAFKGDRGCYTWYTIEECMKKWNIKIGRKQRGKK